MKTVAFCLLLVAGIASAKQFSVKQGGKTCAILTLDGELTLTADKGGDLISNVKLQFEKATLEPNSTCDLIKLDMTQSAQVWFKFDTAKDKGQWLVTPIAAFIPEEVFGAKVNETDPVQEMAQPLDTFSKSMSYSCKAAQTFDFLEATPTPNYNYTVSASVSDFLIQSVDSETPKTGSECPADKKPTQYLCKDGDKKMIVMEGNFTLVVSYNMTNEAGKVVNATETITVPAPEETTSVGSVCPSAKPGDSEKLVINFFKGWSIELDFSKDKDNYFVSNMSATYMFDSHLPNHTSTETGPVTVNFPLAKKYLQASNKGYYICTSNLDRSDNHGVSLTSKNFKYRAFDSDSKGFNGDVSECSADESSNSVVPIAVGAALAGLVVIVLVAYLIGRKRSRKTGYESV